MVSKAFFISRKTTVLTLPRSTINNQSLVQLFKASVAECKERNPHCVLPRISLSVKYLYNCSYNNFSKIRATVGSTEMGL